MSVSINYRLWLRIAFVFICIVHFAYLCANLCKFRQGQCGVWLTLALAVRTYHVYAAFNSFITYALQKFLCHLADLLVPQLNWPHLLPLRSSLSALSHKRLYGARTNEIVLKKIGHCICLLRREWAHNQLPWLYNKTETQLQHTEKNQKLTEKVKTKLNLNITI